MILLNLALHVIHRASEEMTKIFITAADYTRLRATGGKVDGDLDLTRKLINNYLNYKPIVEFTVYLGLVPFN